MCAPGKSCHLISFVGGLGTVVNQCLAGFVAAVRITSLLGMDMLRNTFVTSVARFTMLHAPASAGSMTIKNAKAFRAVLVIADENGNYLGVRPVHSTVVMHCVHASNCGSERERSFKGRLVTSTQSSMCANTSMLLHLQRVLCLGQGCAGGLCVCQ
jgi:hypothetical protein